MGVVLFPIFSFHLAGGIEASPLHSFISRTRDLGQKLSVWLWYTHPMSGFLLFRLLELRNGGTGVKESSSGVISSDLRLCCPTQLKCTTRGPGEPTLITQGEDTSINADHSLKTEFTLKFYMPMKKLQH